ncbi:hypothetical protein ACR777_02370 [Sphingobacterium spiritivorum]|uniref:hypothetical protein n=1 Tax=Sphingobacterium spiritivorum TaxID=258 RepID=UPI003DA27E7A
MMYEINIPTYVINIPKRKDRIAYIIDQFKGKREFDLYFIEASDHPIDAVGLWMTICRIINIAIEKNEDVIILCKDDHEFTNDYDPDKFIASIYEAYRLQASFLLGGILGGFSNIFPLQSGLFWLDAFFGAQFVVVFSNSYKKILEEPFSDQDFVDEKLSEMTSNKFVIFPMISVQKEFGYSDMATNDNMEGYHRFLTQSIMSRMNKINEIYQHFLKIKIEKANRDGINTKQS